MPTPPSLPWPIIEVGPSSATATYTRATFDTAPVWAALQLVAALVFSSYFFFWLFAVGALWLAVCANIISSFGAWCLLGAYITSLFVYKPHKGSGWPFEWFLYSPVVDLVLGYYGARMIREGPPLDPTKRYLFAMSPHGVFGVCRAFSGGRCWTSLCAGVTARWGSFSGAFAIPGVREFSLCCGCLDASRSVLSRAVGRGENIMLLPGGEKEMMLTDGNSNITQLVLAERKGFVRLAITHGLQLVPGFCFGEKWVHEAVRLPGPIRSFLYRHFRIAGVVLIGRWWTFLGQVRRPDGSPISLGFVWGAPIPVRHETQPSDEYVDEVHAAFVAAITDLFERHKRGFGYPADESLGIVSAKRNV